MIAFYLPKLAGGGVEQTVLTLAIELAKRGYQVDLVLTRKCGHYLARVPPSLRIVELGKTSRLAGQLTALRAFPFDATLAARAGVLHRRGIPQIRALRPLAHYLKRDQPAILITQMWPCNLVGIWARALANVTCRIMTVDHNNLSLNAIHRQSRTKLSKAFCKLLAQLYARADVRIAVSDGVADDLASKTGLCGGASIQTIYNPIVDANSTALNTEQTSHRFFEPGEPPVLLAVGRLSIEKDFATLIDAFGRIRQGRAARLVILGEGPEREALTERIVKAGLKADVDLPGWVDNPEAYMAHADVFVLSSVYEGLPTVLIEALACGCPVIATDCPSGPREILADGQYGPLVPVGDALALADAIVRTLDRPIGAQALKKRADDFSIQASVDAYETLIQSLLTPESPRNKQVQNAL